MQSSEKKYLRLRIKLLELADKATDKDAYNYWMNHFYRLYGLVYGFKVIS